MQSEQNIDSESWWRHSWKHLIFRRMENTENIKINPKITSLKYEKLN